MAANRQRGGLCCLALGGGSRRTFAAEQRGGALQQLSHPLQRALLPAADAALGRLPAAQGGASLSEHTQLEKLDTQQLHTHTLTPVHTHTPLSTLTSCCSYHSSLGTAADTS